MVQIGKAGTMRPSGGNEKPPPYNAHIHSPSAPPAFPHYPSPTSKAIVDTHGHLYSAVPTHCPIPPPAPHMKGPPGPHLRTSPGQRPLGPYYGHPEGPPHHPHGPHYYPPGSANVPSASYSSVNLTLNTNAQPDIPRSVSQPAMAQPGYYGQMPACQPVIYHPQPAAGPSTVVVTTGGNSGGTMLVEKKRGRWWLPHWLHCIITLLFPPWLFVWIGCCICGKSTRTKTTIVR